MDFLLALWLTFALRILLVCQWWLLRTLICLGVQIFKYKKRAAWSLGKMESITSVFLRKFAKFFKIAMFKFRINLLLLIDDHSKNNNARFDSWWISTTVNQHNCSRTQLLTTQLFINTTDNKHNCVNQWSTMLWYLAIASTITVPIINHWLECSIITTKRRFQSYY